jgi:citrate synthase
MATAAFLPINPPIHSHPDAFDKQLAFDASLPAPTEALNITDCRTGLRYSIPIKNNSVAATDFKQIKTPEDTSHPVDQNHHGIRIFDPGYQNTAVTKSEITYVNGEKGTIQYRGIPIENLVGKTKFEDSAFLLIFGHLPSDEERQSLCDALSQVKLPPTEVMDTIRAFPRSAPPMTMIMAGLAAFIGINKDIIPAHRGKNIYMGNLKAVDQQIVELLANQALISAFAYCHHENRAFRPPRADLSYIENIFHMTGHVEHATGAPNPRYVEHMEKLWLLVADHEMTCSTAAFLHTASALSDPYTALIAAYSAGYGILHGGAIETAYRVIEGVGSKENVPAKIESVKAGKERLFGYGHRIYKTVDPRSIFIREVLRDLSEEAEKDPFLQIAFEIDRIASSDEYFIKRKLNPNADLFASFAYRAM